jgi:hypothetical protein
VDNRVQYAAVTTTPKQLVETDWQTPTRIGSEKQTQHVLSRAVNVLVSDTTRIIAGQQRKKLPIKQHNELQVQQKKLAPFGWLIGVIGQIVPMTTIQPRGEPSAKQGNAMPTKLMANVPS